MPLSTPTNGFQQGFSALPPERADVKSCRSRMFHRLRSMGDVERLDGPCRQYPDCPRNLQKQSFRQPTRSDAARPRREGETAHPIPAPSRGHIDFPTIESQTLYRARQARRAFAQRAGQLARRFAGVSKDHRLVAAICQGPAGRGGEHPHPLPLSQRARGARALPLSQWARGAKVRSLSQWERGDCHTADRPWRRNVRRVFDARPCKKSR